MEDQLLLVCSGLALPDTNYNIKQTFKDLNNKQTKKR